MAANSKSPASSIEIYFDQTLGMGSYGLVCKAKFGQQPCAAKVLHQSLFQPGCGSGGNQDYIAKFQKECQFLSAIRHPNIVQHLGTAKDPSSGRPVLLMELMDESLTGHLQQATHALPYHSQVNIGYDIALALSYLHSNAIIHRDLSSNNVLLIGDGYRAKVTDFGLYRLIDTNPYASPLSLSQGTLAYMPPEVLILPPDYSSAMDCFSLGVLLLQIVTRKYPEPGDAHRCVEDVKHPSGRVVEQIPEIERRKRDIDLIQPSHSLLSTALDCLKDRKGERPSADVLCERLASLKMEDPYTESVKGSTKEKMLQEEIEAKEKVISDLQEQIKTEDEKHKVETEALKEDLQKTKQLAQEYRLETEAKQKIERVKVEEEKQGEAERHKKEVDELKEDLAGTKQLIEENTLKFEKNEAAQKAAFELELDTITNQHRKEMTELKEDLAATKNLMKERATRFEENEAALKRGFELEMDAAAKQHEKEIAELKEELAASKQLAKENDSKFEKNQATQKRAFELEMETKVKQHKKETNRLREKLEAAKKQAEQHCLDLEKPETAEKQPQEEVDSKQEEPERTQTNTEELTTGEEHGSPTSKESELQDVQKQPSKSAEVMMPASHEETNDSLQALALDPASTGAPEPTATKDPVSSEGDKDQALELEKEPTSGEGTKSGEDEESSDPMKLPVPEITITNEADVQLSSENDSTKDTTLQGDAAKAEDDEEKPSATGSDSMKEPTPTNAEQPTPVNDSVKEPAEGDEGESTKEPTQAEIPHPPIVSGSTEEPVPEGEATKEADASQNAGGETVKATPPTTIVEVAPSTEGKREDPQPSTADTTEDAATATGATESPQPATASNLANGKLDEELEPATKPDTTQEPVPAKEEEPSKAKEPEKKRKKSLIKRKKKQSTAKQQEPEKEPGKEPEPPKKKKLWKRFSKTDLKPDTQKEKSPPLQQLPLKEDPPPAVTPPSPVTMLKWRSGKPLPETLGSLYGTAMFHKDTVYVSRHFNIYSYLVTTDEWEQLPASAYQSFSMAVLENRLTTIGGISRDQKRTNCLYSLVRNRSTKEWEELYPPLPTHRICAATLTTPTHLIVAGGRDRGELCTIEVMSKENYQWLQAVNLPEPMGTLQMVLCAGQVYICMQQALYSQSLEKLLQSCYEEPEASNGSDWTKLTDIPTYSGHCLSCVSDQVLVLGGCNDDDKKTAAIHQYEHETSTWRGKGEMPTARIDALAISVAMDGEESVVVVGGWSNSDSYDSMEIGTQV